MAIYTENSVFRIFRAIGFMVSVATIAQELDHHPNWSNVSNKVNVRLNTHDVGGLTRLDFELAKRMISLQRATRRVERTMASPAINSNA
jgi:4a-hydroxytetrahydrobiopterin dehydratase